jgi:hypothetical protein
MRCGLIPAITTTMTPWLHPVGGLDKNLKGPHHSDLQHLHYGKGNATYIS